MKVSFRFASVLFFTLLPLMGWSQSTLNFPLPVDAANGKMVGYAVVNPNSTAATVTFTAFDESGQATGSASLTVPAGGQLARLFSELFTNANANGWVQATSTATGLQGFTMGGDFVNNVDGLESAEPASDQVLPFVGATTTLVLANPLSGTASLTLRFFDPAGNEISSVTGVDIPAKGVVIKTLDTATFPDMRSVRITAASEFLATAMVAQYLIASPEFALYNGINVNKAANVLNFPHVVSGELQGVEYQTAVALTNLSATPQAVTLTFTPDSGAAPVSAQITFSPGATVREVMTFPGGSFRNGWLQVQSSGPIAGVLAVVNTSPGSSGIAVVQPQLGGSTTMLFPHIANGAPWSTGLAFINPTASPATVEVFAINANGTLIGGAGNAPAARFTLNPGAKTARLLSELIPQAQASNSGFIFVRTSSIPIVGLELFTLRSGGPMANVPASAAGISFTPPVQ
jgi:hypothetical protein